MRKKKYILYFAAAAAAAKYKMYFFFLILQLLLTCLYFRLIYELNAFVPLKAMNLFVLCIYRIPYFYITCLIFLFVNYSFRPKKSLCQKSLPAGTPGRLKNSLHKLFLIHI